MRRLLITSTWPLTAMMSALVSIVVIDDALWDASVCGGTSVDDEGVYLLVGRKLAGGSLVADVLTEEAGARDRSSNRSDAC